jgi:ABC transporter DrrB family efflux protein
MISGPAAPAPAPAPAVVATGTVTARPTVLRDSYLIAGRYQRVLWKNPLRLLYPLVQPLVLLVLFISVFGNLAVGSHAVAGTYRQYLIPGIIIQNAALTAPVTGLALLRDAGSGLADRFRSMPMSRSAVLIGRLASDAVVFTTQAVLLLIAAVGFGFTIRSGVLGAAAIVVVAVGFGLSISVASAWLALTIGDAETAERVLYFPAIALSFVSSVFAPVGYLAAWMRPIARVSPVTAAADLIRAVAAGGGTAWPAFVLCCWVAGLISVLGTIAVRRWQAAP